MAASSIISLGIGNPASVSLFILLGLGPQPDTPLQLVTTPAGAGLSLIDTPAASEPTLAFGPAATELTYVHPKGG